MIEQKVYKPIEPVKKKVNLNWKKLFGIVLISVTFIVIIYTLYPWGKFFFEKYVLKKQAVSTIETSGTSDVKSSENKQDIFFDIETADVKITAPVVEGVSETDFQKGIGHHPETPWPDDKRGNVILAGHSSDLDPNNDYGQVFRDLNKIKIDDRVSIIYPDSEYIYRVVAKYEIEPNDNSLFGQDAGPRLTFYTCSPVFTNWHRLVYIAELDAIKTNNK